MTRFFLTLGFLSALTLGSQAALSFNINGIGPDATPSTTAGAISGSDFDGIVNAAFASSTLDGAASGTMSITLTSLTLDTNGVDDDTAVFNFTVTAAGGTINHSTDLGVNGNGAGRISATTESLTFSYTGGSVTLGAGAAPGAVGTIDFIGFREVGFAQFDNVDGDIATIASGGGSATNVTTDPYSFGADPGDLVVGYNQGGTSNDGFKVADLSARFSLDVVPEPSVLFLSFLGLGLAVMRRRRP